MVSINSKKILMVCHVFAPLFSGATKQALSLASSMHTIGIQSDFIAPNYFNNHFYDKTITDTTIVYRVWGKNWGFALSFFIFLLLNNQKYSHIHFHGFFPTHFICVIVSKLFGKKIVQKLTKGDPKNNELRCAGVFAPIRKFSLTLINDYIAISSSLQRTLELNGVEKQRIHHIPNGVAAGYYFCPKSESKKKYRQLAGLPLDVSILLCVGVIDFRKNNLLLLQSLLYLIDSNQTFKETLLLLFAGPYYNDKYVKIINKFIDDNNLTNNVIFIGDVEHNELKTYYCASNLFVFAGDNEGLPNVLLEAKSTSLPIVALSSAGADDIVQEGIDGYLIPHKDPKEFANKIQELLNDPALYSNFSHKAREDSCKRYDLPTIAKRYEQEIYK